MFVSLPLSPRLTAARSACECRGAQLAEQGLYILNPITAHLPPPSHPTDRIISDCFDYTYRLLTSTPLRMSYPFR